MLRMLACLLFVVLPILKSFHAFGSELVVTKYGAVPDDGQSDTHAIQSAIDTATNVERPIRVQGDAEHQFELVLDKVSISLQEDRKDPPVLHLERFGSVKLTEVKLQNSGHRPVFTARDGKLIQMKSITSVPANTNPFDFTDVADVSQQ